MAGDLAQGEGVGPELPERFDERVRRHPRLHRVLEVAARVHPLGDVPGEEFDEPHRVRAVLRALDDPGAGDVHVLAGSVLVEELHPDRARPVLLLGLLLVRRHLAHVVGVAERHVADPFVDRLRLGPIVALGLAGEIGLDALEPLLGLGLAPVRDDLGEVGDVVAVLARTRAHAPPELRVGEIGGVRDLVFAYPGPVGERHARPRGEAEPEPVGMAQGRGDVRLEHRRRDRFEEPRLDEPVEPADVDGEHRIGRVVLSGGPDLVDHALLREDDVDLDPGLFGELREDGLDEERLAVGVEVDFRHGGGGGGEPWQDRGQEGGRETVPAAARRRGRAGCRSDGNGFHFRPPRTVMMAGWKRDCK